MGIFIHTKFALPLEFKFNSNAPTFSLIGLELSELRWFYKIYPEMEISVMPLQYCNVLVQLKNQSTLMDSSIFKKEIIRNTAGFSSSIIN